MILEAEARVHQPQEFLDKVKSISVELGINPDWLMGIMWNESRFNQTVCNSIGAGGLIGFLPSTAKGLKITVDQLVKMTGVEQLEYVKKFYLGWGGKLKQVKCFMDLYSLTFYSTGVGQPDTYSFPKWITACNSSLDLNKDGYITMGEWKTFIRKQLPKNTLKILGL